MPMDLPPDSAEDRADRDRALGIYGIIATHLSP